MHSGIAGGVDVVRRVGNPGLAGEADAVKVQQGDVVGGAQGLLAAEQGGRGSRIRDLGHGHRGSSEALVEGVGASCASWSSSAISASTRSAKDCDH